MGAGLLLAKEPANAQNQTEKEQIWRQTVYFGATLGHIQMSSLKCVSQTSADATSADAVWLSAEETNAFPNPHTHTHTKGRDNFTTNSQSFTILAWIMSSFYLAGRASVSGFDVTLSPQILFKFNVLTSSRQSRNDWLEAPLMIHPKETKLHRKMSALNRD